MTDQPQPYGRTITKRLVVPAGILDPFLSVQLKFQVQTRIADAYHIVYEPSASVNEYSGRYSEMVNDSFVPSIEYLRKHMHGRETTMKQAEEVQQAIIKARAANFAAYQTVRREDINLAREIARAPLESNNDTIFFWKIDLLSLMIFLEKKRRLRPERVSSLETYLNFFETAAYAVAPYAAQALGIKSGRRVKFTHPSHAQIVDAPPSPAGWEPQETRRLTVKALDEQLFTPRPILDHGFVQAVDYMGDDSSIVESARVSYGAGTRRVQEDHHLIRYLMRHGHTTPFEHCEIAFESRAPLFIDPRQAGRHRTLNWHSFMGEIAVGSNAYTPSDDQLRRQSSTNKQGRGEEIDPAKKEITKAFFHAAYDRQHTLEALLREHHVDEKEIQATKGVGHYTRIWRTGDLHNWLHFLRLRLDAHAQFEIRKLAEQYAHYLRLQCPVAMKAFDDYHLNAMLVTAREVPVFARLLDSDQDVIQGLEVYRRDGLVVVTKESGEKLTREGEELREKLKRLLNLRGGSA